MVTRRCPRSLRRPKRDVLWRRITLPLRGNGSLRLGADRGRQETTVIFADFLGDEFVQQGVHAQYDILILFRIEGEIVCLERVVRQVKELEVVVAQNLLERFRR